MSAPTDTASAEYQAWLVERFGPVPQVTPPVDPLGDPRSWTQIPPEVFSRSRDRARRIRYALIYERRFYEDAPREAFDAVEIVPADECARHDCRAANWHAPACRAAQLEEALSTLVGCYRELGVRFFAYATTGQIALLQCFSEEEWDTATRI